MTHSLLVNPSQSAHAHLLTLLDSDSADTHLFERMSLPSVRDEDWKYTRLSALWKSAFQRVKTLADDTSIHEALKHHPDWYAVGTVVCFVDGIFSAEHSTEPAEWPAGLQIRLATVTDHQVTDAIHALAHASATTGIHLVAGKGQAIERPIILLSIGHTTGALHSLRHRLSIEASASLTLIEVGVAGASQLALTQMDVQVAQNAHYTHLTWQDGAADAFDFGWRSIELARDAQLVQRSLLQGGLISRQQLTVRLMGENAESDVATGVIGLGQQTQDVRTHTHHISPNTRSRQVHRLVLSDQANGVFHGDILVHDGADKTDANMTTNNLLLSPTAQANSKPQLEIYADDVRCTHGVTSGNLDEAQVFYLRARGIPQTQAKLMISAAFAQAAVADVPVPVVANAWQKAIAEGVV